MLAHARSIPLGFAAAQDNLDRLAGAINTAVLLTSGLFAALAVEAARDGQAHARVRRWLAAAAALGIDVPDGQGPRVLRPSSPPGAGLDTPGFFMLYFLITGFHALHVVAGLIILGLVAIWPSLDNLETGAAFWHMVDLIWLIVFPCLYLLR